MSTPSQREYSGRFVVRLPKSLHRALARQADSEGVSLNQLVLTMVSVSLSEVLDLDALPGGQQDREGGGQS